MRSYELLLRAYEAAVRDFKLAYVNYKLAETHPMLQRNLAELRNQLLAVKQLVVDARSELDNFDKHSSGAAGLEGLEY